MVALGPAIELELTGPVGEQNAPASEKPAARQSMTVTSGKMGTRCVRSVQNVFECLYRVRVDCLGNEDTAWLQRSIGLLVEANQVFVLEMLDYLRRKDRAY